MREGQKGNLLLLSLFHGRFEKVQCKKSPRKVIEKMLFSEEKKSALLHYCEFRKSQWSGNHSSLKSVNENFPYFPNLLSNLGAFCFSRVCARNALKPFWVSREAVQERPYVSYGLNKLLLRVYTEIILHFESIKFLGKICDLQHGVNHIQPHVSKYFQQYTPYT